MRRTRIGIVVVLMATSVLMAALGTAAQEGRSLWAPPPVLPPEPPTAPALIPAPKPPETKSPARPPADPPASRVKPKRNQPDPSYIIPAAVYELPQPVERADVPALQQVSGVGIPPPLPTPVPPPLPLPEAPAPRPAELPLGMKGTNFPVPPEKAAPPMPAPPMPAPPVIVMPQAPEPLQTPLPKLESQVPMPTPQPPAPPAPPALSPPAPQSPAPNPVKSFEVIRTTPAHRDMPPPRPVVAVPTALPQAPQAAPSAPLPLNEPNLLVRRQTPELIMEKHGAATLRTGETKQYRIRVRNVGTVHTAQLRIEDDLPVAVRLLASEPAMTMQGGTAVWNLAPLAPQTEQVLRFTLAADTTAEVLNRTSLYVSASLTPIPVVVPAAPVQPVTPTSLQQQAPRPLQPVAVSARAPASGLVVNLHSPGRCSVGKPAVFDVRVSNQTGRPITGLTLYGFLPEGLNTPDGRKIEAKLNNFVLGAGEARTLKMPANPVKAGRYLVEVKVVSQTGHEATAQTAVDIIADSLLIQQAQLERLFVNRSGYYRIDVSNPTSRPLRHVAVIMQLPEGLDYVAASERGLYQANNRIVSWLIDELLPEHTQTLMLRVHGVHAGTHPLVVAAQADGMPETRVAGSCRVESLADLTLKVIDRDNPLEVGRETVYEVHVQNPGSAATTNVQVQVQFPAGLVPRKAEGPSPFKLEQQTVTFEPLAAIGPQGQAVYRVLAVAQTAGDHAVRFAVISDQVRVPITRDINVLVYKGN